MEEKISLFNLKFDLKKSFFSKLEIIVDNNIEIEIKKDKRTD